MIQLKDNKEIRIDVEPPYEAKLTYYDGDEEVFAASIENGLPTITLENSNWLRDSNGELLFDSEKSLIEHI